VAASELLPKLALGQGVFYLVTGLWPIFDIASFELVTGPKTDDWLVKTVGALVTVIGAVLVSTAHQRRFTPEVTMLAIGSALSLATIDLVYVLSGRISEVYLADAAAEIGLAVLWFAGRMRS
jgi:hypothetical protein